MANNKSLGEIVFPRIEIMEYSGSDETFTLEISGNGKKIRVKLFTNQVKDLTDKAREVVGKKRDYVLQKWNSYLRLKNYTGYQSPDGKD